MFINKTKNKILNLENCSLVDAARSSLGDYCINICKAQCCKSGFLLLKDQFEIQGVLKKKEQYSIKNKFLKKNWDGTYSFFLGNSKFNCPSLKGTICTIYYEKYRPLACSNFPLFVYGKSIVTGNCPAIKEGIIDNYLEELKQKGYKIY